MHECGAGPEVVALELDFEQVRRTRSRGWHGLGQTLKSFRDMPAAYPFHGDAEPRRQALGELGPLEIPSRSGASDAGTKPSNGKRFRVVD